MQENNAFTPGIAKPRYFFSSLTIAIKGIMLGKGRCYHCQDILKNGAKAHMLVIEAGRDPATGKRKRIYQSFKGTKPEAKNELARLITKFERGTYIDPSDLTFGQFAYLWLDDYGKLKLSPKSYVRYKQIIDLRVSPWLGAILLDKLKPFHLQQFYKRVIEEGRLDGEMLKK